MMDRACANCGAENDVDDRGLCSLCAAALRGCPFCDLRADACECHGSTMGGD